jgi:hypothetical protein
MLVLSSMKLLRLWIDVNMYISTRCKPNPEISAKIVKSTIVGGVSSLARGRLPGRRGADRGPTNTNGRPSVSGLQPVGKDSL